MLTIAQTNLQLFNQLGRAQWPVADLRHVQATYELAMTLFSAQYRANGKPFLAHLVGTASVLAALKQPAPVVAAGLIHSAFDFGDFGDGNRGITATRQQRLVARAGSEATALVVLYHGLSRATAMERIGGSGLSTCSAVERAVLLIHLADSVEEHADGGVQYAPSKQAFLQNACGTNVCAQILAAMKRLELSANVSDFAELFADLQRYSPPAELICQRRGSFLVAPASWGVRPSVRLRQKWHKLRHRLTRLVSQPGTRAASSMKRAVA